MLDNLYTDIGVKIKNWAKWIFIVEAIGAVIAGIVLLADEFILAGLLTLVCGPIIALVSTWLLYAFGQLVDDTYAIRNQGKKINNIDKNLQAMAQLIIDETNKKVKREADEKVKRRAEAISKCKAEENAEQIVQKKDKAILEKLEYALKFQSDEGMINYLKGIQDETVQSILESPQYLVREQIESLLSDM